MQSIHPYRVEIAGALRFIELNFIKPGEVDNLPHGWIRYIESGWIQGWPGVSPPVTEKGAVFDPCNTLIQTLVYLIDEGSANNKQQEAHIS